MLQIGSTYGLWTVIESGLRKANSTKSFSNCRCQCGIVKLVQDYTLTTGKSTSCGCQIGKVDFSDMSGKTFGRLTVVKRSQRMKDNSGTTRDYWHCICSCGNKEMVEIQGKHLRSGTTESCGCIVKKHGMRDSIEYSTWRSMRKRCLDLNNKQYDRYGGRGIKICDRWNKFENFYADMGDRPSKLHSIDRIDNDGDYTPENCKWSTDVEQNTNRGDFNKPLTYNGITMTQSQWAKKMGCRDNVLNNRLKAGWSVEKTLSTPVKQYAKR
jgi:hypothetical protein